MNFLESIRISWRAITGHKLRSTLTTLGIIIGIAAVIAFQVLGGGLQEDLLGDIETDQDPIITVQTQEEQEFGQQTVGTPIYTQTDVERIENLSGVEFVSPQAQILATELRYGNETTLRTSLGGQGELFGVAATRPSQFNTSLFNITEGRAFTSGTNETVVNENLASRLGENFSVGDQITIKLNGTDEKFTVTGIVDDGDTGPVGDRAYVPIDPYYTTTTETPRGTQERVYPGLVVGAESFDELESTKQEIIDYMESDSDAKQLLAETGDENLTIAVQTIEDILDQFASILDQITLFLGGIAAISLLVGSIGIANIMIVSVTERTREIGVMKAVGAKKRDVIQLFLVEALILGIIGAVFGVLVGLGFGYLGVSYFSWPMAYPLDWITIAVIVGVIVGVVSGIYPAWRAARVDPIEALRRE
jgi:putative ABC transport system permease protein